MPDQIHLTLTREEARGLGAFADAFRTLAKDIPDLHGHEALPHMGSACAKLRAALDQPQPEHCDGKERRWSEQWTLGAGGTGAVAITGPSLYGEQTVEVVPKLEAEQHLAPQPVLRGEGEAVAQRAVAAIDALFEHLQPLVEEGGGLSLYEAMKPVAEARASLAAFTQHPHSDPEGDWPAVVVQRTDGPPGRNLLILDGTQSTDFTNCRLYLPAPETGGGEG